MLFDEHFYRSIVDSSWDWEYLSNSISERIIFMSPSAEYQTGYLVQDFFDNFFLLRDIVYPDDLPLWLEHVQEHKCTEICITHSLLEYRIITKDGRVKWFEHICRPFFDDDGAYIGRRVSNRDITEQKETQNALDNRRAKYESELLSNIPELVWLKDENGAFLACNPAFEKYIGQPSAKLLGKKSSDVFASFGLIEKMLEIESDAIDSKTAEIACVDMVYPDGTTIIAEVTKLPIYDNNGDFIGVLGVAKDITSQKKIENDLRQLAHFDALTKLPNRVMLADRMGLAISHSKRTSEILAICVLDLDGFKPVNDTYGHKAGDLVLQEISARLLRAIRGDDTAARLGGDEFALLLGGLKSIQECEKVLSRIVEEIALPIELGAGSVRVSASIGVTFFPIDGADADTLIRHADIAMYQAKQSGKNKYCFFDNAHEQKMKANQNALKKIKKGLENGEFCLYYQPKVDCRQGVVVGAEALVRWKHPMFGIIAPSQFLPLIENDDIIVDMGIFVIKAALTQMKAWKEAGLILPVSINIAAKQLRRVDFFDHLKAILDEFEYDSLGVALEIEIVETAALEDVNIVSNLIQKSKAIGVGFSLDDFGTGYSSLVHLKHLCVDTLKIDQTFVHDMLDDPENLAIVEGIIGLAHAFDRRLVAEGVESIEHILMLLEIGCDIMQGYCISRPIASEKMFEWVGAFVGDPRWSLASAPRPDKGDFHLLLAEANHRYWVDSIITASKECSLTHRAMHLPPLQVSECRFGQWFYSDGKQRYGKHKEFEALEPLHESAHFYAKEVLECANRDDLDGLVQNQEELLRVSSRLVATLHRLRGAIIEEKNTKNKRIKK
jgi:diguanylate cyclase (GGDEF)-like protein/PAS domain S-box-containing protein